MVINLGSIFKIIEIDKDKIRPVYIQVEKNGDYFVGFNDSDYTQCYKASNIDGKLNIDKIRYPEYYYYFMATAGQDTKFVIDIDDVRKIIKYMFEFKNEDSKLSINNIATVAVDVSDKKIVLAGVIKNGEDKIKWKCTKEAGKEASFNIDGLWE